MIHPPECTCDTYGCRKRREGYGHVSMAATPSRTRRIDPDRRPRWNSWEKGVSGEHRPDGSFMPYLDGNGDRLHVKEYGENRREFDAIRARQVQDPSPKE